jgi:tetratricopeptide (TPR) repeat protein
MENEVNNSTASEATNGAAVAEDTTKASENDNNETQPTEFTATVVEETTEELSEYYDHEKNLEKALELKNEANAQHKQSNYTEAIEQYKEALKWCPNEDNKNTAILYSNIAVSSFRLENYLDCIEFATKAQKLDENYIKPYLFRAEAQWKLDKLEEALEDYEKAEKIDPYNNEVVYKLPQLKKKVEKDRENKKEEVIKNLKDLGNQALGFFGLSIDNFKMQQQPGGGYNIQFQK